MHIALHKRELPVAGASGSSPSTERPAPRLLANAMAKARQLLFFLSAFQFFSISAFADNVSATWNFPTDVPVTTASYTASGNSVTFTLNCVPTSNELTVIRITGPVFIEGAFSNLAQGQAVDLSYSGATYHFVANYYGGSGNDLVLVWTGSRAYTWGENTYGQLGENSRAQRNLPVAVDAAGVLLGRTVVATAAGSDHSLALCSDGTLAAWGYNYDGELGTNNTTLSKVPVAVNATAGVSSLSGKTVIAVAAGEMHSLALCADGTVAAWGFNYDGELGNGTTDDSLVPVAVNRDAGISALAGRVVTAVSAGQYHNLALCSDGTVAAWGNNTAGELGNDRVTGSLFPVPVNRSGVLAAKTVVAVAAGAYHSLALCSDGTVVSWGDNTHGQLGINNTTNSLVPVPVNTTSGVSALSGKTVTAIAAGADHSMALCSDGAIVAWGRNFEGQLGDNTTTQRPVPVFVNTTGMSALSTRTVAAISAGRNHSVALCTDGTVAGWGWNGSGQLGDDTTMQRGVPTSVGTASLAAGEHFTKLACGSSADHTASLAANLPAAVPAISVELSAGIALSNGASAVDLGTSLVGNSTPSTFTIRNRGTSTLTSLMVTLDGGDPGDFSVVASPTFPVVPGSFTTFTVVFTPSAAGLRSAALHIASNDPANAPFSLTVTGTGTVLSRFSAVWNSPDDIPATAGNYLAAGQMVDFTLNCVPAANELMVIQNTGSDFIHGRFGNLAQGQKVALNHAGKTYNFVANYHGGSGNDLVLVWAWNRVFAWGWGPYGQLGDGTLTDRKVPGPVATDLGDEVLLGRTVVSVSAGGQDGHSLALCSDGTVAAWGANRYGELGDGTTSNRSIPIEVNGRGALNGRTVVAVSSGYTHSLALCSDGSVTAWGDNSNNQLGNNSATNSPVPIAVDKSGVLSGKTVVAISAGGAHSLALCSDGTVAAWGMGSSGQLGIGSGGNRSVPVAVNTTAGVSALAGKTVVAVAAGCYHSMALCSDGTVAGWGNGYAGSVPVAVNAAAGSALFNKVVTAIAAGPGQSFAVCSDGTVAAWGANDTGQLGDGTTTYRGIPVAVNMTAGSALYGKSVRAISVGENFSLAVCSDGTLAAWGLNNSGELGDNSTTRQLSPVAVNRSALAPDERCTRISGGKGFSLVVVAFPGDPSASRANLANLVLSEGVLSPAFASDTTSYAATVASGADSLTVRPTVADRGTVTVNGWAVHSNRSSIPIPLEVGSNTLSIVVTSLDGSASKTYTVSVIRPAETHTLNATWNSVADVAVTSSNYTATGSLIDFTLNCVPLAGELTVIRNIGQDFIHGTFSNLTQGQSVTLSYGGVSYHFVANYYGGNGNDLALVWAGTRVFAWGRNYYGQLGDGTMSDVPDPHIPRPVRAALGDGLLLGKTVVAVAAPVNGSHCLALCADGRVFSWGDNRYGQLGDGTTANRSVPVAVNMEAGLALYGKVVIAVGAGGKHSLALCSDGTIAAWGEGGRGQLGNNSLTSSLVPTAAYQTGVLAGKMVTAVSAGNNHSLALCSDGTVAAWGDNYFGNLGDGTTTINSPYCKNVPVAVDRTGVLSGKTVVALAAGEASNLVLCSDGSMAAWGYNSNGGLGDGSNSDHRVPFPVNTALGISALAGKTVTALAAGYRHCLALCSDGSIAAWGANDAGQTGDGTKLGRTLPVAMNAAAGSALYGKTVTSLTTSYLSSMMVCSDGTLAACGSSVAVPGVSSLVPTAVDRSALGAEERFTRVVNGSDVNLALVASSVRPPAPTCATTAAGDLSLTSARLNGSANANGFDTKVTFLYGTDGIAFPNTINAVPGALNGVGNVAVTAQLSGLQKGTRDHYRVSAVGQGGSVVGEIRSFITLAEPTVTLGAVSVLSTNRAEVSAIVNAHGSDTQVFVDYGTDAGNLFYSVPVPPVATGYDGTAMSVVLGNLPQGTTYFYRLRATSVAGQGASAVGSFQLATLSGLTQVFPAAPPDAQGYVFVTLGPADIATGWRFVGEQQWRASGVPVGGLATGDRMIEFRPVPGFIQPPQETVGVVSGEAATLIERTYYETPALGSGGLTVTLKPDSLADETVPVNTRAQWRLLGEDDTEWRNSDVSLTNMTPGNYLIECKPVAGRTTPPAANVVVQNGQAAAITITYSLADPLTGTQPNLIPFETVTTDPTKPYAHVGQIRSNVGSSSGFVVKPRVVATAGHVVFDDGTLSAMTGLQWLFQRHRGTYEPKPQIPRGFYIFDGYAAQRSLENTPGTSSPQSQHLDAAALYFLEDAGRGGYGGFLASDLDDNEFLLSSAAENAGGFSGGRYRRFLSGKDARDPADQREFAPGFGQTFTTAAIRSSGGMSGGPLCVQYQNGALLSRRRSIWEARGKRWCGRSTAR